MVVRIITVNVKAGREADFEEKTRANHLGSIAEAGVLRFDVLKDADAPGTYYLYEVYRDQEATVAHKETEHYHAWKAGVADLLAGDRTSVTCTPIAPTESKDW